MALTLRRLESETAAELLLCSLVLWLSAEDISILEPENIIIIKVHSLIVIYNAGTYSVY